MLEHVLYQQINKDHAFWPEKRSVGQRGGGNTAGLLTHVVDDVPKTSLLFDAGLGTMEGLWDLPGFSWPWPVEIFITHGHIDHHAELLLLSEAWCGREAPARRGPIVVHCTSDTFDFIRPVHAHAFGDGNTLTYAPLESGHAEQVGIFTVHAIGVDHLKGAAIYVVEFGGQKVAIAWDMKTLPNPDTHPILKQASLALVETNTWTALSHRTGHTSVEEVVASGFLDQVVALPLGANRYGAHLVHYSGREDPGGGLTDHELARKIHATYPAHEFVGVAARGQTWRFSL